MHQHENKILMIVSNPIAFDSRVKKEAETLVEAGYVVHFMGWDRDAAKDEIKVIDENYTHKILATNRFEKFLRKRPFQMVSWWLKVIKRAKDLEFDVVHCHDLDTLAIGIVLKLKYSCKLIYDSHEYFLWMLKRGVERYLIWFYWLIEKLGQLFVDCLIVTDSRKKLYFQRFYRYKNIVVVRNTK